MDDLRSSVFVVASAGLFEIGKAVTDRLKELKIQAVFKSAAETAIPDLAPCGIYLFGAGGAEDLQTGDYKDLYRSLQGVNFAGRYGAFFTQKGSEGFSGLKKMLKDSDLRILEPGFIAKPGWESSLTPWLKGLVEQIGNQTV